MYNVYFMRRYQTTWLVKKGSSNKYNVPAILENGMTNATFLENYR